MPVLGQTPTEANLNDTTPAAPTGSVNVKWQASTAYPDPNNPSLELRDISASVAEFTGDSGSGGAIGAVPPPGPGDAAAGKFLKADGTWAITPAAGGGFSPGGDLSGSSSSQQVIGLQSKPIDGGPTDGNVLKYSASSGKWEPTPLPMGAFAAGGDLSGTSSSQQVIGLQSKPIDGGPTDGDALQYSSSSAKWEPTALALRSRQILTTAPVTGGGDLSADRTLAVSDMTGDSGSGGTRGTVPAPVAGTAAAGKFLKADGTWAVPPGAGAAGLTVGFIINSGAAGTNVGPMLAAPRAGTFSKCVIVTKASDGSTGLTIKIKQNGTDVFSADPTVAAGTASGTVSTSAALTSVPLPVAAGDVFSIDVATGTSAWNFTAQLET
jgi:hypothetical protein